MKIKFLMTFNQLKLCPVPLLNRSSFLFPMSDNKHIYNIQYLILIDFLSLNVLKMKDTLDEIVISSYLPGF